MQSPLRVRVSETMFVPGWPGTNVLVLVLGRHRDDKPALFFDLFLLLC